MRNEVFAMDTRAAIPLGKTPVFTTSDGVKNAVMCTINLLRYGSDSVQLISRAKPSDIQEEEQELRSLLSELELAGEKFVVARKTCSYTITKQTVENPSEK